MDISHCRTEGFFASFESNEQNIPLLLCRICEMDKIPADYMERHSELCLNKHEKLIQLRSIDQNLLELGEGFTNHLNDLYSEDKKKKLKFVLENRKFEIQELSPRNKRPGSSSGLRKFVMNPLSVTSTMTPDRIRRKSLTLYSEKALPLTSKFISLKSHTPSQKSNSSLSSPMSPMSAAADVFQLPSQHLHNASTKPPLNRNNVHPTSPNTQSSTSHIPAQPFIAIRDSPPVKEKKHIEDSALSNEKPENNKKFSFSHMVSPTKPRHSLEGNELLNKKREYLSDGSQHAKINSQNPTFPHIQITHAPTTIFSPSDLTSQSTSPYPKMTGLTRSTTYIERGNTMNLFGDNFNSRISAPMSYKSKVADINPKKKAQKKTRALELICDIEKRKSLDRQASHRQILVESKEATNIRKLARAPTLATLSLADLNKQLIPKFTRSQKFVGLDIENLDSSSPESSISPPKSSSLPSQPIKFTLLLKNLSVLSPDKVQVGAQSNLLKSSMTYVEPSQSMPVQQSRRLSQKIGHMNISESPFETIKEQNEEEDINLHTNIPKLTVEGNDNKEITPTPISISDSQVDDPDDPNNQNSIKLESQPKIVISSPLKGNNIFSVDSPKYFSTPDILDFSRRDKFFNARQHNRRELSLKGVKDYVNKERKKTIFYEKEAIGAAIRNVKNLRDISRKGFKLNATLNRDWITEANELLCKLEKAKELLFTQTIEETCRKLEKYLISKRESLRVIVQLEKKMAQLLSTKRKSKTKEISDIKFSDLDQMLLDNSVENNKIKEPQSAKLMNYEDSNSDDFSESEEDEGLGLSENITRQISTVSVNTHLLPKKRNTNNLEKKESNLTIHQNGQRRTSMCEKLISYEPIEEENIKLGNIRRAQSMILQETDFEFAITNEQLWQNHSCLIDYIPIPELTGVPQESRPIIRRSQSVIILKIYIGKNNSWRIRDYPTS